MRKSATCNLLLAKNERSTDFTMARPVTLFTGQWADLPLTELAPLAKKMGFDGLELAFVGATISTSTKLRNPATTAANVGGSLPMPVSPHLVFRIISSGRRSAITLTSDTEEFSRRKSGATATRKVFASALRKT